jgi:Uma2 family endonuclease
MAVHVDPSLPVHPLTVTDVEAMVGTGILDPTDRVQLLDGVLVEMSPQGNSHAYAIRRLSALAFPAVADAGLELSIQSPLDVGSSISLPEPDLAVIPVTARDERPAGALLVVEMGATSLRLDLGRKAEIYATAGIPEYWVLDVDQRVLVVHREPLDGQYRHIRQRAEEETVHAAALELAVPVAVLL